jgi:branched-subunit amino acid transport protein
MKWVWLVLGCSLVTFLERYPMLALAGRAKLPGPVARALKYVPPAVLAAIIVPDVLLRDGAMSISWHNAQLVASVVGLVTMWLTRQLLLTIVAGMATLLLWHAWLH